VRKPAEAAKLDGANVEVAARDFDVPETLEAALQLEGVRSVGAVKPMLLSAHRGSPEARPTDAGRGDITR